MSVSQKTSEKLFIGPVKESGLAGIGQKILNGSFAPELTFENFRV